MSIAKIQKGDTVKIISGGFKGTVGEVLKIVKKTLKNGTIRIRASVSGVAQIVKYRKANKAAGMPGQMSQTDRLVDVSNLSLVTKDGAVSRVKVTFDKAGKKMRTLTKNGETVEKKTVKALEEEPKKEEKKAKAPAKAKKKESDK